MTVLNPLNSPIARTNGSPIPCCVPGDTPHQAHDSCPGRAATIAGDFVMDATSAASLDYFHIARQYGLAAANQLYPVPPITITAATQGV